MLWVANRWRAIVVLYFTTILAGAAVFCAAESGHSYWKSVWWAFITGLSIGYGDVFPVTITGQITGVIMAHIILMLIVPMIVAQVTLRLILDEHQYTDEEQEEDKRDRAYALAQRDHIIAQQVYVTEVLRLIATDVTLPSPPPPPPVREDVIKKAVEM